MVIELGNRVVVVKARNRRVVFGLTGGYLAILLATTSTATRTDTLYGSSYVFFGRAL